MNNKNLCRLTILHVKDNNEFIKNFNSNIPSNEFLMSCKKAWKLFGEEEKKMKENDNGK